MENGSLHWFCSLCLKNFLDFCNALFICINCFEWMMTGRLLIFKTGNSTNQAVVYEVKLAKFRFMLFDVRDAHSFSVPPPLGKDSKTTNSFFHLILHSWPSKATWAQKNPEGGEVTVSWENWRCALKEWRGLHSVCHTEFASVQHLHVWQTRMSSEWGTASSPGQCVASSEASPTS